MVATTFNFTKADILRLPIPANGMETYRDTKEKGLSLYITANRVITFFVRKRINGKDERIKLGNFPVMSVEQARKEALLAKGRAAQGVNPNAAKKALREETTLGDLFESYMERYSKQHKRSWQYDEREIPKFLSHWFKRRLSQITKADVQALHDKIRSDNGLYQANRTLERLRAMYNKAIEWGWDGKNPTQGIKKFKEQSRDRFIQPAELPFLFKALAEEENQTARDYVLLSLYTGARKSNVLAMRWEEISWERNEWRIPETKNGEPVVVALVNRAVSLLKDRKAAQTGKWVLPSEATSTTQKSASGHFADPKRAWKRILTRATLHAWSADANSASLMESVKSSLPDDYTHADLYDEILERSQKQKHDLPAGLMDIRLHDIRRTLGSYQAIGGASLQIIGKSLGHKSQHATQIYSRLNLDPVRASLERATELIFGNNQ